MKKRWRNSLLILLALILLLTLFSSCSESEKSPESITGEEMANLTPQSDASLPKESISRAGGSGMDEEEIIALVKDLTEKGDEVFWWYMGDGTGLDVDESDIDNIKVCPVGRFKTIAELKAATEAVYSRQFCKNILYPVGFDENQGDGIKFREIDGALHINLDNGGMGWSNGLTDEIFVKSNEADKIVVTISCTEGFDDEPEMVPFDFALVWEDDGWKLDNWFDYGAS